jgi:hypothetical protein
MRSKDDILKKRQKKKKKHIKNSIGIFARCLGREGVIRQLQKHGFNEEEINTVMQSDDIKHYLESRNVMLFEDIAGWTRVIFNFLMGSFIFAGFSALLPTARGTGTCSWGGLILIGLAIFGSGYALIRWNTGGGRRSGESIFSFFIAIKEHLIRFVIFFMFLSMVELFWPFKKNTSYTIPEVLSILAVNAILALLWAVAGYNFFSRYLGLEKLLDWFEK